MSHSLFVELDAIFDTRLSILNKYYSDEIVEKNITEDYFNRSIDRFTDIGYEDFKEKYATRDSSILLDTITTHVPGLIKDFVFNSVKSAINGPTGKITPKVTINTYPYKLSNKDKEFFRDMMVSLTNGYADIKIVDMSYKEITPQYLDSNVSVMILYDYTAWLDANAEVFKYKTVPDVSLIAPAIYFKIPNRNAVNKVLAMGTDVFREVIYFTSIFINLKLLPVAFFSAAVDLNKTKEKETI